MYKRGKSWYSDFYYKGERYTQCHGPVSKTVAKEREHALRAAVASGEYAKQKNNSTFNDALDEYLKASMATNQPSTYTRNIASTKYLKPHFGKHRIRDIESNEILMRQYVKKRKNQIQKKQLAAGRSEQELSFTTINRELALVRKMFNVLIKAGKAAKNPANETAK